MREARAAPQSVLDGLARPDGLLEAREGICLHVLARRAAALGDIIEIGSWKGRSTWYLVEALRALSSDRRVVAIDPHLEGTAAAFAANVERLQMVPYLDLRRGYSHEVVGGFDRPVGMLWIDGDHSYEAVRRDFDDWFPRLATGGWVAFHDTVNHWHGPTKLVRELLARRDDLERVGVIGMVTYARKAAPSRRHRCGALAGRLGFEAVTALRAVRVGWGPRNRIPDER